MISIQSQLDMDLQSYYEECDKKTSAMVTDLANTLEQIDGDINQAIVQQSEAAEHNEADHLLELL